MEADGFCFFAMMGNHQNLFYDGKQRAGTIF